MNKAFKVLVTGATGFIGRHVSQRLLSQGIQVKAMVRSLTKAKIPALKGAQIFRADIRDSEAIRIGTKGCNAVIHLAAILGNKPNSWADFRSVNVEGTRLLAEAAIEAEVKKFVYVSTVWVYGLDAKPGTNEKSPRRFSNDPYSDTKLEAENIILELCHKKGLPAIIVQPTHVYGPGDETWTLAPYKTNEESSSFSARRGQWADATSLYR